MAAYCAIFGEAFPSLAVYSDTYIDISFLDLHDTVIKNSAQASDSRRRTILA
jgi:hypothetical protein